MRGVPHKVLDALGAQHTATLAKASKVFSLTAQSFRGRLAALMVVAVRRSLPASMMWMILGWEFPPFLAPLTLTARNYFVGVIAVVLA